MKIVVLGGGPAGLYSALLIKKANPVHDITIIERNAPGVTYGWGVVFSDRTLASFQRADNKSYEQITNHFVIWDNIDILYRDQKLSCGGHVISSISRKSLLNILQNRCRELGVDLQFRREINNPSDLGDYDLLIAADGLNSIVRKKYESNFKPGIEYGKARYIWLGADKVLDAFTFIFRENEHGLFQVHSYPFNATTSTFIIECDEASWLNAGLDKADESQSLAYCQHLLADNLGEARLLSNNSRWISFPMLKTQHWHYKNIVLLGDAIHTAHFSIGSGTKLAMEDAIALSSALEQHADLETALNAYELERKPVVEIFQKAARESQTYFETLKRHMTLEPVPFTFNLLTRSGRITYDDLRLRDQRFGDLVDRWYANKAISQFSMDHPSTMQTKIIFSPPPVFTAFKLRNVHLPNRIVLSPSSNCAAHNGRLVEAFANQLKNVARSGTGLVEIGQVAVSALGRITPDCAGIYQADHVDVWKQVVALIHNYTSSMVAIQLNHAGRRGSTRSRANGLDIPLQEDNWPLFSASSIPYSPSNQIPKEMNQADMDNVRNDFVLATKRAYEAGFDLLQLNFSQGYLLASFISPLTNHRLDEFGGDLQYRMRFPLAIFDAVRETWPLEKPIAVTISADDCVKDGLNVNDAIEIAKMLKNH
ncbi:MAG TPA: FAD-dependent monooxygenase, partial [Ktedonobacteraceae bacterium]|nr:FAD-dependent monooxygenase [Ktedonobacteraceae bacterium]